VLADDAAIADDLDDPGGATARDGNADSDDDGVTVPPRARPADAARPANASGSGSANTGASPRSSRPQPRTGGSAQRRPGPRKKRR
jgi:hypothetical protein